VADGCGEHQLDFNLLTKAELGIVLGATINKQQAAQLHHMLQFIQIQRRAEFPSWYWEIRKGRLILEGTEWGRYFEDLLPDTCLAAMTLDLFHQKILLTHPIICLLHYYLCMYPKTLAFGRGA
jgi:hypothetical protein